MTSPDLRTIRHKLGLDVVSLGRALGYRGTSSAIETTIRRFELGTRPMPPWISRLARMYERYGVPEEWLSNGKMRTIKK